MPQHTKGILISLLGVFILSPDAILIRLVNAETWTILFWRGLLFALGIIIIVVFTYRRKTLYQFKKIGKLGLFSGFIFGLSTIFFVTAIQFTTIANALVLISTSPVFSALLGKVFLGEKTNIRTWLFMLIIIGATVSIMIDSINTGGLWGDISALMTSLLLAINFTITRHAKNINMVPAMAVAGLTTSVIALIVIFLTTTPLYIEASAIPYLLLMGLVLAFAFTLLTLAPRYIPAAEVSMILQMETVYASYLAWYFINEVPSERVVIGGLIIIITLMIHAWLSVKDKKTSI